jgi:MFS family permease
MDEKEIGFKFRLVELLLVSSGILVAIMGIIVTRTENVSNLFSLINSFINFIASAILYVIVITIVPERMFENKWVKLSFFFIVVIVSFLFSAFLGIFIGLSMILGIIVKSSTALIYYVVFGVLLFSALYDKKTMKELYQRFSKKRQSKSIIEEKEQDKIKYNIDFFLKVAEIVAALCIGFGLMWLTLSGQVSDEMFRSLELLKPNITEKDIELIQQNPKIKMMDTISEIFYISFFVSIFILSIAFVYYFIWKSKKLQKSIQKS